MKKFRYVNFCNPYKCEKNWFIRMYKLTQYSTKRPFSYLVYAFSIFFNRFAFALLANNIKLNTTASIDNKRFTIRSTNSQFHSIYFYEECYEPDVFAAIDIFLPGEGGVFVDIGSNWGHHTFIAALNKNAKVYAFEPNESVYRDLIDIAKELNCDDRVSAFNVGVGSSKSKANLVQLRFESGIASVSDEFLKNRFLRARWLEKIVNSISFHKPIERMIDIVRLDDVLPTDTKIDLIKIDAEGFEFDCLNGMKMLLVKQNTAVLFELHTDATGDFGQYQDFFDTLNYQLYEIVTNVNRKECCFIEIDKLKPFTQYNLLAAKTLDI